MVIADQGQVCPFCAETVRAEAVKCKHCGEWLRETADLQEPRSTPTPASRPHNTGRDSAPREGCPTGCSCLLMLLLCLVLPLAALVGEGWAAFGIMLYIGIVAFGLLMVILDWLVRW